jgi:RNA polymerase sigma-70 factor (ECF subfamily)
MSGKVVDDRLSRLSTDWSVIERAHRGAKGAARAAQELLLLRYGPPIRRYLGRILKDPEAVEDLFQEFGIALVEGKFGRADPHRGRFRDYVKVSLRNLVSKYYDKRNHAPRALGDAGPALEQLVTRPGADDSLDEEWRDTLLDRAWSALAEANPRGYEVFRFMSEHHELSSQELAAKLIERLGRAFTAMSVRQTIHRARKQFALFLIEEVGHSLVTPTADTVARELADLGLLEYCRPMLKS